MENLIDEVLMLIDCGKTGGMDVCELIEWVGKHDGYSLAQIEDAKEYYAENF